MTEVDAQLEVVLFAAECDVVLELKPLLRSDLVEAVRVAQARQVERPLNAVDADPLRRIVTDLRERFLSAGDDLILRVGVLEPDLVQQLRRDDPGVPDGRRVGLLLEIESRIGGPGAAASKARLLAPLLP